MNFTKEDYIHIRVHFSIHVDSSQLKLRNDKSVTQQQQQQDLEETGSIADDDSYVVAVVGSCEELGKWNPYKALHLSHTMAQPQVWTGSTVVKTQSATPRTPTSVAPHSPESPTSMFLTSSLPPHVMEYKYIILKKIRSEEFDDDQQAETQTTTTTTTTTTPPHISIPATSATRQSFELYRWETIVGNRKLVAPADVLSIDVDDGEFGVEKENHRKQNVDEGWLSDPTKIELRINVGTYQKYGSTPLKLYTSEFKDTPFSIQMFLVDYPCHNKMRRRLHTTLSRWIYSGETDTVGRPGIFYDEEIDCWKDGDIQVFSTYTSSLYKRAIEINILSLPPDEKLIGKAIIIPQMLLPPMFNKEHTNLCNNRNGGHLNLPIMGVLDGQSQGTSSNSLTVVGELNCNYLICNPFIHPENNLATLWRTHWLARGRTLDIGHRGMGRSYHQVAPYPKAFLTENTILSLVAAAQNGADFVEFDVHLTKDAIPVVYHDLSFYVQLKRTWSKKEYQRYKENLEISVNQLTLEQLRRVKTHPIPKHKHIFQNLLREHWNDILSHMKTGQENNHEEAEKIPLDLKATHQFTDEQVSKFKSIIEQVPTLEEALKAVPRHVGFNVEIKYPETTTEKITFFEMNFFLDTILKVLFDHAGSRRIILSCFDPDICTLCRLKQPRYPVFFLTSGGHIDILEDVRCNSIEQALMFAKSERLLGIIPCSTPLMQNLNLINRIKDEGIILFTWGDDNNDERNIQVQRERGVDAVIYDNIGTLVKPSSSAEEREKNMREWYAHSPPCVSVSTGTKTPTTMGNVPDEVHTGATLLNRTEDNEKKQDIKSPPTIMINHQPVADHLTAKRVL